MGHSSVEKEPLFFTSMSPAKYILNETGEPQKCDDLMSWANWYEGADRSVAVNVQGDYLISTVFLGLDYSFSIRANAPPILWETMVFKNGDSLYFDRCGGSREQALAMHEDVKKQVSQEIIELRNNASKLQHMITDG